MPAEAFLHAALIPNDLLTNVFSQNFQGSVFRYSSHLFPQYFSSDSFDFLK